MICPQCKGRFSVPADDAESADALSLVDTPASLDLAGLTEADRSPDLSSLVESAAAGPTTPAAEGDGGMGFLDSLGPTSAAPVKTKTTSTATAPVRSAVRPTVKTPVASVSRTAKASTTGGSRATAGRAKKQAEQMTMIYIGGGIAAAVLLIIIVAVAINSSSGGGTTAVEDVRFGLPEHTRIKLFQELVSAVDEYGITKECKKKWYDLADEYKLDRSNIKDLLDEGFAFKNKRWVLPEATSTAKNRAVRMEWVAARAHGPDPVLSM